MTNMQTFRLPGSLLCSIYKFGCPWVREIGDTQTKMAEKRRVRLVQPWCILAKF